MVDRLKIILPARPRGAIKCICFAASLVLVSLMLTRGIPVRVHPLYPDRFVVPEAALSRLQLRELIKRPDFIFLSTVVFLATPTGSNQTYTSDATWNNSSNSIETIGGGASGGASTDSNGSTGGGGAAWNKITNFNFATPGTTTATYQIASGGASVSSQHSGTFAVNGNDGGDTWFNGSTLAGSSVGSKGGVHGLGNAGSISGGAGGVGSSGQGTSSNDGGKGGDCNGSNQAAGGGGAAGPNGPGNPGVNNTTAQSATAGGSADAGSGGAAGSGAAYTDGGNGGPGTEYDASHGSGGGGGGGHSYDSFSFPTGNGGNGGLYGGGGGGANNQNANSAGGTVFSGAGAKGLVILTWVPVAATTVQYSTFSPVLFTPGSGPQWNLSTPKAYPFQAIVSGSVGTCADAGAAVTGIGAAQASSIGSSTGAATVTGVSGAGGSQAVGASVGTASVTGISASIAASIGSSVGQAVVAAYAMSKGGGDSTPSGLHAGLMKGRISTGRIRAGRMKR